MKFLEAVALIAIIYGALLSNNLAQATSFAGYECTDDCSGHAAGYRWARDHDIDDPDRCGGNSNSFIEGCEAYALGYSATIETDSGYEKDFDVDNPNDNADKPSDDVDDPSDSDDEDDGPPLAF